AVVLTNVLSQTDKFTDDQLAEIQKAFSARISSIQGMYSSLFDTESRVLSSLNKQVKDLQTKINNITIPTNTGGNNELSPAEIYLSQNAPTTSKTSKDPLLEAATGVVTGTVQAVSGDWEGVARGIQDFKDKFVGGFASGGIFEPNDPKLVMVGDNKSEREFISPISTMREAVTQAIRDMGGVSDSKPIQIIVQLDGQTLARQLFRYTNQNNLRKGLSPI
ncbi:MAG: hypothetical protein IJ592_04890, partial [Candidatus Methanomethylophilaceae archaeon]|nr:hypothetical protein [Candidatus Methanomethylophilaceae archaeon]